VRALVRREIGRAAVVAVRDELSQRLLSGLGVSRAAEVTADLAFLLPAPTEAEMAAAREKAGLSGVSEPLAAIALRRGPGRSDQEDVLRMAGAIGKGCEALGLRPLLVAMQPSQDAALAEAAAGAFPGGNALIASGLRAREMLALVGGCQMVIGMRLHALIFAALCRLPLVAISYDPKVDGLLAQLGVRPAADLRRAEGERLAQAIGEAWREREGICRGVAERLPGLRSLALRNVELALRLRSGLALSVLPRR
jgi:polysaccharide pyruvyl transferase WcaK-like protein